MQTTAYENYPCRTVILSNLVSLATYVSGALIIYRLGLLWMLIFLIYVIGLEIRLLKGSCVNCYYYGKFCAFGKGKLSALIFKKGDPKTFQKASISWRDLLPDLLVSLVPLLVGIILLLHDFNWPVLLLVLLLVILASSGNGYVRGSLACKFCKQREIGCPAEQLFNKKESARKSC